MLCVKCGQEYEGSQCPRCEGPVVLVNNSDYLARKKAYEEKQNKKEEPPKAFEDIISNIAKSVSENKRSDRSKDKKEGKIKAEEKEEVKGPVTRKAKFKLSKRVLISCGIAAFLVLVVLGILVYKLATKKHYALYMSYNGKIYDVTNVESNYVCELSDVIFTSDMETFYIEDYPSQIKSEQVIQSVASEEGKTFSAVIFNSSTNKYSFCIWDKDYCYVSDEDDFHKKILYVSDDGTLIYTDTAILNDEGKTGNTSLKMAEFGKKKDTNITVIGGDIEEEYIYSDKEIIIYLDTEKQLAVYNYDKKQRSLIEGDVTELRIMDEKQPGRYSNSVSQLNKTKDADAFLYTYNGNIYYYELSSGNKLKICKNNGYIADYIYDKKNSMIYEVSLSSVKCANVKEKEVSEFIDIDEIGNDRNYIYIKDSLELIYVNNESDLVKVKAGSRSVLANDVLDGSLSKVINMSKGITYIIDGCQYFSENADKEGVGIYMHGKLKSTNDTCYYRKHLYFYDNDKTLYSSTTKGTDINNIGKIDRLWIGKKLK